MRIPYTSAYSAGMMMMMMMMMRAIIARNFLKMDVFSYLDPLSAYFYALKDHLKARVPYVL